MVKKKDDGEDDTPVSLVGDEGRLVKNLLRKTPPALISKREGPGGMMLSYVSWAVVARRLTEAFGVWSFQMMGNPVEIEMPPTKKGQARKEVMVTMCITTPSIPGWSVEGTGSAVYFPETEQAYSDVIQSAESYALRRIAARIGPGQDLYAQTEEPQKDPELEDAIKEWKAELNSQGLPPAMAIAVISTAVVKDPKGFKTLKDALDATGKEGAAAYQSIISILRSAAKSVSTKTNSE